MPLTKDKHLDFPVNFGSIFGKSVNHLKDFFLNYSLLSLVVYLPILIIEAISSKYLLISYTILHGALLDILVFLTLPTLYMSNRVYPLATLQLFFQRFFVSGLIICLIQTAIFVFLIQLIARLSVLGLVIGSIPFVYFLFPGFFLIIDNSPDKVSVQINLLNSVRVVRTRFFPVLLNFVGITAAVSLPGLILISWIFFNHPDSSILFALLKNNPENTTLFMEKYLELIQNIALSPTFKWSDIIVHMVFRPLKSLFLCFLFLGILFQINPALVKKYLGINEPDKEIDDSFDSEDQLPGQHEIH